MRLNIWIVLTILFISSVAFANDLPKDSPGEAKRFSAVLDVESSRNTYDKEEYEASREIYTGLSMNYRLAGALDGYRLKFVVSGIKDLDHSKDNDVNDGWVGINNRTFFHSSDIARLGWDLRVMVPMSDISRKSERNTAVRLRLPMVLDLSSGLSGLTLYCTPSMMRNFYTNDTAGGTTLPEYKFIGSLELNWEVTDKWTLYLGSSLVAPWNHNGTHGRDQVYLAQEVSYTVNDHLYLTVGHSNTNEFFHAEEGDAGEIKVHEDTSRFYLLTSVSI